MSIALKMAYNHPSENIYCNGANNMIEEALTDDFIEILACPKCKQELDYKKKDNKLHCDKCKVDYPVKKGMLILMA